MFIQIKKTKLQQYKFNTMDDFCIMLMFNELKFLSVIGRFSLVMIGDKKYFLYPLNRPLTRMILDIRTHVIHGKKYICIFCQIG